MALRYNDKDRHLRLSVRDVVEAGMPHGHLSLELVRSRLARAEAGRQVHVDWQQDRASEDLAFRPEVRVEHQQLVGDWTVTIQGRLDGLTQEGHTLVVEEAKSTALDAGRLLGSRPTDWPGYVAQLEVYLWMVHHDRRQTPTGRLVLVSLADGCRHVLGVPLELERVEAWILQRLEELVQARERRLSWLASRRQAQVPWPFAGERGGQARLRDFIHEGLAAGRPLLAQAPTGLGKTASTMVGALRHAYLQDRQLFWATARGTHQLIAEQTAQRLVEAGLALRAVTLTARDKVCLNEIVACRPEDCAYAKGYYDKLRSTQLLPSLAAQGVVSADDLRDAGRTHQVCPFQLALDLAAEVDLVIGDTNYAFAPGVRLRRLLEEDGRDWVVVADEAHQLVERARSYGSPEVDAKRAKQASAQLRATDPERYAPFIELADQVVRTIQESALDPCGPSKGGMTVVLLSTVRWRELADQIDELGLDYALLKADRPATQPGEPDPWIDSARAVLRFADALEQAGEETVALSVCAAGEVVAVRLLCLDPSARIGPQIAQLGGFIGISATLSPVTYYRDLLGLRDPLELSLPSPFAPDHRSVIIAPRVSTTFRDRAAQAEPTAKLLSALIAAFEGNVAVYFPSFAMLDDLVARWEIDPAQALVQRPKLDEATRRDWLAQLQRPGKRVLAAVLGGIFAEGIDLPANALQGVIVIGPGLPPVGLERDLLRDFYQQRYGDGFAYASLIPGLTRVIQAAGRLIRGPEDRGVVVLVGRRFRWRDYAALLPDDFQTQLPDQPADAVRAFFARLSS